MIITVDFAIGLNYNPNPMDVTVFEKYLHTDFQRYLYSLQDITQQNTLHMTRS